MRKLFSGYIAFINAIGIAFLFLFAGKRAKSSISSVRIIRLFLGAIILGILLGFVINLFPQTIKNFDGYYSENISKLKTYSANIKKEELESSIALFDQYYSEQYMKDIKLKIFIYSVFASICILWLFELLIYLLVNIENKRKIDSELESVK